MPISNEIDDPRKWRVSMSGYSIKTGWGDEKRIVASILSDTKPEALEAWLHVAQQLCDAHNATLAAHDELLAIVKDCREPIDNLLCPTQWVTAEGRKHSDLCKRIDAALAARGEG